MAGRPNILWIVTTQWRAQACGYAGDPNARTPALDALAAAGTDYAQAVTPHPFGPFARAAMLTGKPSPQNGVVDYFDPLPAEARTVAGDMESQGYATAFFGKWHLGRRDPAAPLVGEAHARTVVLPGARGRFGFWEGFEGGFLLNDPWLHGTRLPEPVKFEGYQADVVGERAAGWLRSLDPDTPWFCVVSLETPHPPYDALAAGVAPRDPASILLAPNVPGGEIEATARRELAGYYAHLEATDRAIGRLLASIPPALTVFTSVHGDMHGAHGLFRKGWPHEESVRVPLIIRLPPGAPPQPRRSEQLVSLLNLPAWTSSWADAPSLRALGGVSPMVGGRPRFQAISMPSVVRLPHQCDRVWRGIRTRERKLVLNADGSPWLLFDLDGDSLELDNRAGDPARADEISALRELLATGRAPAGR